MGADLERLAKALCDAEGLDPDCDIRHAPGGVILTMPVSVFASKTPYPIWRARVQAVRAILQELREPSEGMVDVGQASLDHTPIKFCEQQATQVWQNVIDHILKEDQ